MNEPYQILLVEDSLPDAHLAQRAFRESSFESVVVHAQDGEQALAMLQNEGDYADQTRPDLVLLDLNLPGINGRQVLNRIRSDENLKSIPVVILSTSSHEDDVAESYRLGGNSYVVKPVELSDFFNVIERTQHYWFRVCTLPASRS